MTIIPIAKAVMPCFGICCPVHQRCARYHAVEGQHTVEPIATCEDGAGERPHFVGRPEEAQTA